MRVQPPAPVLATLLSAILLVPASPATAQSFHYAQECVSNVDNATIYVSGTDSLILPNGHPIEPTDTLAVYTARGTCAGYGVWQEGGVTVAAAGPSPPSSTPTGYTSGEPLKFEVYDVSAGRVVKLDSSVTYASCDGTKLPVCRDNGIYARGTVHRIVDFGNASALLTTLLDSLVVNGAPLQLTNVGALFSFAPDEGPPAIAATSSNPSILSTRVGNRDQTVTLTPGGPGSVNMTLSARNGEKKITSDPFPVIVRSDSSKEIPSERAIAMAVPTRGKSTDIELGATGMEGRFWNVNTTGSIDARFVRGADAEENVSTGPERFKNVSDYRWRVQTQHVTFDSINVRIRLGDEDVPGLNEPEATTIVLDADGDGWFEPVPTVFSDRSTPSDSTDDVLIAQGLTQLGTFRLASNSPSAPLPVELTKFTATRDGKRVLLKWHTASETKNAGFEVLHQAPAEEEYVRIGFIEGAGTTATPQTYRFRTGTLVPGTHHFRLRQLDADGTKTRTEPVAVTIDAERTLTLRATGPNPVRQSTQFAFTVARRGPARIALFDVLGQRVKHVYNQVAMPGDRHAVVVPVHILASGTYFVRLYAPSGVRTRRIVVVQ